MFFKKKKEEYIEVEYCDSLDVEEIKIKKDGIEFNITIKETKDTHYVWFVYAFIKKFNRFKLLAFLNFCVATNQRFQRFLHE